MNKFIVCFYVQTQTLSSFIAHLYICKARYRIQQGHFIPHYTEITITATQITPKMSQNPSNSRLILPQPTPATTNTAHDDLEQETTRKTHPVATLINEDLNPHQIAIKRTKTAKERLAVVHEGWTLAAQAFIRTGTLPADAALTKEMQALGNAICGRYAAASFLWSVLVDMPAEDWFGPRAKFDDTLRRLKTLKGLEASLVCWEGVVLELVEVVDGTISEGGEEEVRRRVREVLEKWQSGLPSKP